MTKEISPTVTTNNVKQLRTATLPPKFPKSKGPMPTLKEGLKYSYTSIRADEADKAYLKQEAEKLGLNVSGWIRQLTGLEPSTHLKPKTQPVRTTQGETYGADLPEQLSLESIYLDRQKLEDIEVEADLSGLSVLSYIAERLPIYLGAYQLKTEDLEIRLNLDKGILLPTYRNYVAGGEYITSKVFGMTLAELDPLGLPWDFDDKETWTCVFSPKKRTKTDLERLLP